jgi:hypothetical protein
MLRNCLSAAAFVAVLASAQGASATTYVASFTAGPVTDVYRPPFGADVGTSFSGSLRYDSDLGQLTAFRFVAPERTFSLRDVDRQEFQVGPDSINYFFVRFLGGLISSNNTASVSVETPVSGFAYCNGCVTFTSGIAAVPEPASWAMMIGGTGLVGGAMRRRRSVSTKVSFA